MLEIDLNDTEPTHVERIKPQMTVTEAGDVVWTPSLLDYDASVFYRGRTVSNQEFNTLFLRQLYQGNYITDSLSELLNKHLNSVVRRQFENTYELKMSYIKIFTSADWGELQEDGYYYITVPASEHGFEAIQSEEAIESINIDTNLYLLNVSEDFYEINQVEIDSDNTVKIYTDDNTVSGFLIIRSNERSYALTGSTIDVNQVTNLATVAKTGLYSDLIGTPDNQITKNATDISKIIRGDLTIRNALNAKNLTEDATFANGISFKDVFEEGSRVVKDATNATNATNAQNATNYDITNGTIKKEFNSIKETIKNIQTNYYKKTDTIANASLSTELSGTVTSNNLSFKVANQTITMGW